MQTLFLSSLGVIGGADGSTTIFVTTTPDAVLWLALLLTAISFGLIGWRRKRRS